MSRSITALFDSRSEAEAARERLTQSRIDADNVKILDQSSGSSGESGSEGGGFWSSVKDAFMPDEDRHAYQEGINRGGFLLCAKVDEDQADEAVRLLEESDSVDFDERQESWRSEGWQPYSGGSADMGAQALGGAQGSGMNSGSMGSSGDSYAQPRENTIEEEHIPIVEEQLLVGKRESNRGGARVRSYVREMPVHEQVQLREEHVSVERRPVSGQSMPSEGSMGGDTFRERNIEMTETSEVPMVSKEARVAEEVVVKKTSEQRTEQVDDTVRRTEVDIDQGGGQSGGSAFGFEQERQSSASQDESRGVNLEQSTFDRDR